MRNSVRAFFKFSSNPLVGGGRFPWVSKMRPAFFVFAWVRLYSYYTMGGEKAQYFFQNIKIFIDKKK